MPFGKGRRKLWFGLGFLMAGLAAIWVLCPVWFPWVMQTLAPRAGARFGRYERQGYSRFVLRDIVVTNESLVVHARRVDALVPSSWAWRLFAGRAGSGENFLSVSNWDCRLLPSNKPAQPVFSKAQDAASTFRSLGKWLPRAAFSNGTILSGDTTIAVAAATWTSGALQAQIKLPPKLSEQAVEVQLAQAHPFEVRVTWPAQGINSSISLSTNRSGLDLHSMSEWRSNRVEIESHFGPADTLPQTASLQASNFHAPGELIGLARYRDLSGSLSGKWQSGRFQIDVSAAGAPVAAESNLPPVDVNLSAQGDTNSVVIRTLDIRTPFLQAQLASEVAVAFSAPFLQGPARLRLTADLGLQRWIALTGKLSGQVDISAGRDKYPQAQLQVSGANIGNDLVVANSLNASATFAWPAVSVSSLNLQFDDGSAASLSGNVDLAQKTATNGQFQFQGPLLQRWIPAGYSYDRLSVTGTFEGPIEHPSHSGRLAALGIETPNVLRSSLSLRWDGQDKDLRHFELQLDQTNASLTAAGALNFDPEKMRLQLDRFVLLTNRSQALALTAPATLNFTLPQTNAGWRLDTTPLSWNGPAGELNLQSSVRWPEQGAVQVSLRHFPVDFLGHFTKASFPLVTVNQLAAAMNWSNGPATLRLEASGTGLAKPSQDSQVIDKQKGDASATPDAAEKLLATPLNFELRLSGDSHGLTVSNLVINTATGSVATARGFLPLTLTPSSPTNLLEIAPETDLRLDATVRPEAFFWQNLAELTGVRLRDPVLDLNLSGTWKAPQGQVSFQAQSIQFRQTNFLRVNLENPRLNLSLDRDKARLTEGQLLVQGQRVALTGELPLGESAWTGLLHKRLPPWDRATARFLVQDAELAAFEPLFPELLAPQGSLNIDMQLLPGARLEGALILRHARTRPLGNTAPVRDINVTLRFRDRFLTLENATASLSGAEVNLSGKVDLRGTNWIGGSLPPFDLVLRGTNVPLAREPDYIIRSDLDLAVAKTNDAPPVVFGSAHLHDSFFLSDLAGLVPGKVAAPSARPPFFSIDNPTLADWRLAVNVDGVRWLRVRTSLFNGEVSANFHLQGTLLEPLALGVLKVDSGLVRFPFANLQVQQGLVTLASQDPYHPQLLVRASSKQFGYDIRMEVTGAADAPIIQFTSNPSLSSEQILLMITAGQLPPGTFTLTPQQRAQTVALFLGRDLLSKLGMGDQSQERLTISSGQEISEQGRPTYHVEYKLTKRWSVEGEYDRFGDFNAGLKWRVYSK